MGRFTTGFRRQATARRFSAGRAADKRLPAGLSPDRPHRPVTTGTAMLAGLELGGIPLAIAISLHTGHPCVFVRKAAKAYGTEKAVEGPPVRGKRTAIIEDVVTTGGASCRGRRVDWGISSVAMSAPSRLESSCAPRSSELMLTRH